MRRPDLARLLAATFLAVFAHYVTKSAARAQAEPPSGNPPVTTEQAKPASTAAAPAAPAQARKVELVSSEAPRSLEQSQQVSDPAWQVIPYLVLCDPVPCLGDAPKAVFTDGRWTIHFPDSYRKPDPEKSDAKKTPAPPDRR